MVGSKSAYWAASDYWTLANPVELAFKYQENGTDGLVFITDPK